jgi:hypothetical protein
MGFTTAQWLNLGVNVVLPAVVALITAADAHPGLKSIVLLFLSSLSGSLTTALQAADAGQHVTFNNLASTIVVGFATAILAHFGVLKPMNLTGATGRIAARTPRGLGGGGRHEK